MTRADLTAALATRFSCLTVEDADISVKEMLDAMAHTLAQGGRVEIRDFGSFCLNYRPPRTGRNPKSGETVLVAEKGSSRKSVGRVQWSVGLKGAWVLGFGGVQERRNWA